MELIKAKPENEIAFLLKEVYLQNAMIGNRLEIRLKEITLKLNSVTSLLTEAEERNKDLLEKIDELQAEVEKLNAKKIKKERKKKKLRDPITYEQLLFTWKLIDGGLGKEELNQILKNLPQGAKIKATPRNNKTKARAKLILAILFITGMRFSNIFEIKKQELKVFFEDKNKAPGVFRIDRIKRQKEIDIKIDVTEKMKEFFSRFKKDYILLTKDLKNENLVFSKIKNPNVPLCREPLSRTLNNCLFLSGVFFKNNLKTHSCRTNYISQAIFVKGEIIAQDLAGHKSLSSTAKYYRNILSTSESREMNDSILARQLREE